MARYMLLYELDTTRTPEDSKAKKAQLLGFDEAMARYNLPAQNHNRRVLV